MGLYSMFVSTVGTVVNSTTAIADSVTEGASSLHKLAKIGSNNVDDMLIKQQELRATRLASAIETEKKDILIEYHKSLSKHNDYIQQHSESFAKAKSTLDTKVAELEAKLFNKSAE